MSMSSTAAQKNNELNNTIKKKLILKIKVIH